MRASRRLSGLFVLLMVTSLGLVAMPSVAHHEDPNRFSCEATGAEVAFPPNPVSSSFTVAEANPGNSPCIDDDEAVFTSEAAPIEIEDILAAQAILAETFDNGADGGEAHAIVVGAQVMNLGLPDIGAAVLESRASVNCGLEFPVLTGSSRIIGLDIDGSDALAPLNPAPNTTIPLGPLGNIILNYQVSTSDSLTVEALRIETAVGITVSIARSVADFSGSPCGHQDTTGGPGNWSCRADAAAFENLLGGALPDLYVATANDPNAPCEDDDEVLTESDAIDDDIEQFLDFAAAYAATADNGSAGATAEAWIADANVHLFDPSGGTTDRLDVRVDLVQSNASVVCVDGAPVFEGTSQVLGLNVAANGAPILPFLPIDFDPTVVNNVLLDASPLIKITANHQVETADTFTVNALFIETALGNVSLARSTVDVEPPICGGGPKPPTITVSPPFALNEVGDTHEATATVRDGNGDLLEGAAVQFTIIAGPHDGEVSDPGECSVNPDCTTDSNGQTTWTYVGTTEGIDTIQACIVGTSICDVGFKKWDTPTVTPDPPTAVNQLPQDDEHVITATVTLDGNPLVDWPVSFEVTSGPNAGAASDPADGNCTPADCQTDDNGQVVWTYENALVQSGEDTIEICATSPDTAKTYCTTAMKTWTETTIELNPEFAVNQLPEDDEHTVDATVKEDGTPVSGALVTFTVLSGPNAGKSSSPPNDGVCSPADCTTNSNGVVTWTYQTNGPGVDTIQACVTRDGATTCDEAMKEWRAPDDGNAVLLLIDEDSIDNGSPPNFFSDTDVNDDIADVGLRTELRWFDQHPGSVITLYTGQTGDEGFFTITEVPSSWVAAGPTDDGLRNYVGHPSQPKPHGVGPGLGSGNDPESRLDKIPGIPLRNPELEDLVGRDICAVVYDSDISHNTDPDNLNLQGANLGTVAFTVLDVLGPGGGDSSSLNAVEIQVLDAETVCERDLVLLQDAVNASARVPSSSALVLLVVGAGVSAMAVSRRLAAVTAMLEM